MEEFRELRSFNAFARKLKFTASRKRLYLNGIILWKEGNAYRGHLQKQIRCKNRTV